MDPLDQLARRFTYPGARMYLVALVFMFLAYSAGVYVFYIDSHFSRKSLIVFRWCLVGSIVYVFIFYAVVLMSSDILVDSQGIVRKRFFLNIQRLRWEDVEKVVISQTFVPNGQKYRSFVFTPKSRLGFWPKSFYRIPIAENLRNRTALIDELNRHIRVHELKVELENNPDKANIQSIPY